MTSTTILTVLLVFGFIIGRFLRRFETPHFVFSGMIYLLVGLLLGSYLGLGILTDEMLYKLEPMTDLMTGLAGFLLGLRMKFLLANRRTFLSGLSNGIVVFWVTSIALFIISPIALEFSPSALEVSALIDWLQNQGAPSFITDSIAQINRRQFWFALGTAATASSASLLSLGMISKFNKTTSEITKALSIVAPSGQVVAVGLLGILLALAQAEVSATSLHISLPEWLLATLTSGLLCGLLFSLFIGKQSDQNRIMLAALGAIIFASGIGAILGVSSMFVCFVTGMTISLFSSYSDNLKKSLVQVEEPIFVLLLVIGGASWQPEFNRVWLLPITYFIIRGGVFSVMTDLIYQRFTSSKLHRLGQGLLGQDLIAVALALSLAKEFPELSQLFLTTILGSIFFNDVVANTLLKRVILDNEQLIEVKPITEEAAQ